MKLKYYTKDNKKIYTLKENQPNSDDKTKDAHYKFIKIKVLQREGIMPQRGM